MKMSNLPKSKQRIFIALMSMVLVFISIAPYVSAGLDYRVYFLDEKHRETYNGDWLEVWLQVEIHEMGANYYYYYTCSYSKSTPSPNYYWGPVTFTHGDNDDGHQCEAGAILYAIEPIRSFYCWVTFDESDWTFDEGGNNW